MHAAEAIAVGSRDCSTIKSLQLLLWRCLRTWVSGLGQLVVSFPSEMKHTHNTHTHTSMDLFQGAALTARKTLEMLTPDSTHPQQAESSAKPIDTRSRSLEGLVATEVKAATEEESSMAKCLKSALSSLSSPPLFTLPEFELLLLLLVLLLHITHQHVLRALVHQDVQILS